MSDVTGSGPDDGVGIVTSRAPDATPVAFVADGMIEPLAPPASTVGFVGWVRANLFSGWFNSILTLLSIALLVWLIPALWTWAVSHAVWSADSLDECRRLMDERFGEGVRGACWAVITERFEQFMLGFYPAELRWRPVLAFVLFFVALAPILFDALPGRRQLLWLSAAYPVIAYFLLWGGSIWPFASFLAGLGAAIFAGTALLKLDHPVLGSVGVAVAGAIAVLVAYLNVIDPVVVGGLTGAFGEVGPTPVGSDDFGGFMLTCIIGVFAIGNSLWIGTLLALGRQSGLIFIRMVSVIFIEFIRGVPLITLLFVASTLLNYFLPPGTEFDIILRVLIMVTFFASAYVAEAIRGGLAALPKGQYEAADAMGLTYWQSMRLIILPQALKISIPSIVNIFIGVFKDSVLVSIIGLLDPLGIIQPILADSRWQGIFAETYIFVAVLFFFCCYGMSRYSMYLERRLKTDRS